MKYLAIFLLIALVYAGGNKNKGGGNKKKGGGNKNKGGRGNGGPVNSCQKQSECLNTRITQVGDQYEICIWWDSHLRNCGKGSMDTISHVCYGTEERHKREGCNSGQKICRTVDCDDYAAFGLKDGSDCEANEDGTYVKAFGFSEVEGIICKAGTQGGMCGGGAKKDCAWYIPAPKCEDSTTTTTDSPDNTATTPPGGDTSTTEETKDTTTAAPPCVRTPPENDVCGRPSNTADNCEDASEDQNGGCVWDDVNGICTRVCAFYPVAGGVCADTCGCVPVGSDCMTNTLVSGASSAGMRIDEYVVDDEYDAIDESGNDEWIKGVDNMWVYIGIGVVGLMVILIVGLVVYKVVNRKKYVEMEDDNVEEIQMNEIQVENQGFNTVATR